MNNGCTPLFIASLVGHVDIVRELLARGALPSVAANNGATALSAATANGHAAIAQLLRAAIEAAR
jgi:ankyrin repeat protein